MSSVEVFINDEGKPANIPDYATIIAQCFELGPRQTTAINISGVHIAVDKRSDDDISDIWVKSGRNVTMGEAMTQRFVAQYLQANGHDVRAPRVYLAFMWGHFGYIVSEFIDGRMCNNSDTALVAAAVQALIAIPSPSSRPGPVGGGLGPSEEAWARRRRPDRTPLLHRPEVLHPIRILSVTGRDMRVNLRDEVANYGLRLCASDLKLVNFMKDKDGRIVAVDYGGYSFLPPSFFALALGYGAFAHELSTMLKYPLCKDDTTALVTASCALAPFDTNNIGVPKQLRSRRRY